MKRQSVLFVALAIATLATAQTNIEELLDSIITSGDMTLLSKSRYEDESKNPTTYCHCIEVTMAKTTFDKLEGKLALSASEERDAYKIFRMIPGVSTYSRFSIPYGRQNEYSVTFGSHTDHNYLVALFHDKANSQKRHAYAIVWYDKGENVIMMYYHIYGDDPAQTHNQRVITYDGSQLIDNNGYVVTGLENMESTINDDIDFMKRFGTLCASVMSADVDKTLVFYGLVTKIADLCKKHANLLSDNERATCDKSLANLIKFYTMGDPYVAGMLEEARIALKK